MALMITGAVVFAVGAFFGSDSTGHQPEKARQQAARAAGLPILCSLAKSCPKYSGRQRPKVPGRGSA